MKVSLDLNIHTCIAINYESFIEFNIHTCIAINYESFFEFEHTYMYSYKL